MTRRKPHSGEELPFVALMDTMTNVVGVLIIVLVMVGISLANSVRKVLSDLPPVSVEEHATLQKEVEAATPKHDPTKVDAEIAKLEVDVKKSAEQLATMDVTKDQQNIKVIDLDALTKQLAEKKKERAEKKARLMDANAADPSPARVTVEAALDAFIARKQGQRLSHSWLYKFSLMQRELVSFAQGRGLTYIDEFSDDELGLLSRSWKVAPITAQKRQERWHSFFSYCVRKRWLKQNPVDELGPIKVRQVPTDYFSQEEFQKLVNVTYDLSHWSTNPGHRVRVRALLLLMGYGGLRLNGSRRPIARRRSCRGHRSSR